MTIWMSGFLPAGSYHHHHVPKISQVSSFFHGAILDYFGAKIDTFRTLRLPDFRTEEFPVRSDEFRLFQDFPQGKANVRFQSGQVDLHRALGRAGGMVAGC